MNETLQIIVAILGILSQFLVLGKELSHSGGGGRGEGSASVQMIKRKWETRSLLDLSFVFICAAFFSLLLTDALLVSGQSPSSGLWAVVVVFIIATSVVLIMFGAWCLNVLELVTGFLAVTTLAVLVISSGGPFFSPSSEAAASRTLYDLIVPVATLVAIASTMFIYALGNPLSRAVPQRKRMTVSLILLGLTLVAAGSLGKQLVKDVERSRRTPKIESAEGKQLLESVMGGSVEERRYFYRLASEVNLAHTYQKYYRTLRQEEAQAVRPVVAETSPGGEGEGVGGAGGGMGGGSATAGGGVGGGVGGGGVVSGRGPQRPASPPSVAAGAGPVGSGSQPGASPQPSAAPSPRATPAPATPPEWLIEQRRRLRAEIDRARLDDDYRKVSILETALEKLFAREVSPELGFGRTKFFKDYFEASGLNAQEKYLTDRLEWVHPVGIGNQSEAAISLPGTASEDRFEKTSVYRVFKALNDQPTLRNRMLGEFNYPDEVLKYFNDLEKRYDYRGRLVGNAEEEPPPNLYQPGLLPKFDSTISSTRLVEQLSLPRREEGYVAYHQYKHLAGLLTRDQFREQINVEHLNSVSESFNQLDDAAQDAFLYYVIKNKKVQPKDVYRMLLDLKDVQNFQRLADSQDALVIEKMASVLHQMGQGNSGELSKLAPELQALAAEINSVRNADAKHTLFELLHQQSQNSEVPIKRLFQRQVFQLVDQMHQTLGASRAEEFFEAVADPIGLVSTHLARIKASQSAREAGGRKFPVDGYVESFRKLPTEDQEGVLLQLAIALYQTGGPYSHDPVRLLVSQARFLGDSVALSCASLLMLPLVLLCIFAGGYFSRRLVARDRTRELVSEEPPGFAEGETTVGSPVDLVGRGDVLGSLRSLAERGWSTIGVVGRRGVGKSRILYSLSKEHADESEAPTVKVWVSSPSKFQEEDFIFSIFERLALRTEGAIASHLGAKPLSTRKIESRTAQVGALFYLGAMVVLAVVIYGMYSRLTRADVIITWLPILAIIFTSVWLFFSHVSRLQPVDLSGWLQRDRTHNSQTVMLYREVYDALKFLRRRGRSGQAEWLAPRRSLLRLVGMSVLAVVFFIAAFAVAVIVGGPGGPSTSAETRAFVVGVVVGVLSLVGWLYLYHQSTQSDERAAAYGHSVMSLIADYRAFAASIVHRLRQGALGHRSERKFSVLICIDELDKIVDFEEIRAFVRRIKAIFEVPGVYYYVSLAEDALTALYLGPAEGKNEIDSAFDHIVRIPPLTCAKGEEVAADYLASHGAAELPPRLARTISAVSYGIPRDIIRRCDELIARGGLREFNPGALAGELRRGQALLGYELKQLSLEQMEAFSGGHEAAAHRGLVSFVGDDRPAAEQRLILSLWLLSLVEAAVARRDERDWLEASERLCEAGYKIPVVPVSDVRDEIARVHEAVLGECLDISQGALQHMSVEGPTPFAAGRKAGEGKNGEEPAGAEGLGTQRPR